MNSNSSFSTCENTEYDSLMIKEKIELDLKKNIIKEPTNSILEKLDEYDKKMSNPIHNLELNCFFECIIYFFARMYNVDTISFYFIITLLYKSYFDNDYYFILRPLTHVIIILIITLSTKFFFGRKRPELKTNVKRLFNCRNSENNCSMPSGDSMQAANFAILILFYFGNFIGFFFVPFVMFARVYYFCHYIFDTVIGALMGFIISYSLIFELDLLFSYFKIL